MSDLSFRDQNLRMTLVKAFADWCAAMIKNERSSHQAILAAKYVDEGTKSFDVKLPDGPKVATITLSVSQPKTEVVDADALVEWARQNEPGLLEEVITPAVPPRFVPAHTVEGIPESREWVLNGKRVTEFLGLVKAVDIAGGPVIRVETGDLVDGIQHSPGGEPISFAVKFVDSDPEPVILAYRSGELSHLVGGTPLPAIEAAAVQS